MLAVNHGCRDLLQVGVLVMTGVRARTHMKPPPPSPFPEKMNDVNPQSRDWAVVLAKKKQAYNRHAMRLECRCHWDDMPCCRASKEENRPRKSSLLRMMSPYMHRLVCIGGRANSEHLRTQLAPVLSGLVPFQFSFSRVSGRAANAHTTTFQ
jgi:hypothetical protein